MTIRLTDKLLSFVYSALNKSPEPYIAFRVQHADGHFSYQISGYTITCSVNGVEVFSDDLSNYTLLSLAVAIGTLSGVTIVYRLDDESMGLSARVLMEGAGDQALSNGDAFYAFNSLLWVLFDSLGRELVAAGVAIEDMLLQMSMKTAGDIWLDYWGEHFGVPRNAGELDPAYARRVIVEVLRPRGNNKAIEAAFYERFGQRSQVVDTLGYHGAYNSYDGYIEHDGSNLYDGSANIFYGLFTVVIGYDLEGADSPNDFADTVRVFVEKFRDAGTQMQSLGLASSLLTDAYPRRESDLLMVALENLFSDTYLVESETFNPLAAVLSILVDLASSANDDALGLSVTSTTAYDGARTYGGLVRHQSGMALDEVWS